MKVLVVGAGSTGALVAYLLAKCRNVSAITIQIWEKSRGCGGRMSRTILNTPSGEDNCSIDIGAQYISNVRKYQLPHSQFYDSLQGASVLVPMRDKEIVGQQTEDQETNHYISPTGLSAIAKHFISQSGAEVRLQTRLERIESQDDGVLAVCENGVQERFDLVVLTMPTPQILSLSGLLELLDEEEKEALSAVKYSSRFALAVRLPESCKVPVTWTAMYVKDNPCIRYVCLDSRKRGHDEPATLAVHTSVPYGITHLERDKDDMTDDILGHLRSVLPWLPENRDELIVKSHKWRYSQVLQVVPGEPGYMTLRRQPRVVLCGDAFTHSNLDGCVSSALKTVDSILQKTAL